MYLRGFHPRVVNSESRPRVRVNPSAGPQGHVPRHLPTPSDSGTWPWVTRPTRGKRKPANYFTPGELVYRFQSCCYEIYSRHDLYPPLLILPRSLQILSVAINVPLTSSHNPPNTPSLTILLKNFLIPLLLHF